MATRDEERYAKPGETIFQHVKRVVAHWEDNQRWVVFDGLPQELQRRYPEVFGRMDVRELGVICSLVWLHLDHPTEPGLRKWFEKRLMVNSPSSRSGGG